MIKRYPPNVYNAGPSIFHILHSSSDILYFATNKGILQYDGARWSNIEVANHADIRCLAEANDGTIYVGADNDFGYLHTDSLGHLVFKSLAEPVRQSLDDFGEVWQVVFIDSDVYFQSYESIFRWDGERIEIVPVIDAYIFDVGGQLYGSAFKSFSLGPIVDKKIKPIERIPFEDVLFASFPLEEDRYLFVTSLSGMFIYHRDDNTVTTFDNEANEFLMKYAFFDGIKLRDDLFAFGTWEGGLLFMNDSGEIIKTIDRNNGLPMNKVHHVALGNNGNLWLGTSDGIVQLNLGDFPELLWEGKREPGLAFVREAIGISEYEFFHHHYQNPLDSTLILPFSTNSFNLELHFTNPKMTGEKVVYQSRLEGYTDKWSSWDQTTTKTFSNIGPGVYTFLIRSRDENGLESPVSSFSIRVEVPWFLVFGKYLAFVAIIGLASFIFFRIRTMRLRRTNERLEQLVEKRTNELLRHQHELERTNKELLSANKELDNFVYHTSHDLKAPLKSVLGLVTLSKKETTENKALLQYMDMIEKSVHKLEEFIKSVIEYSVNAKAEVTPKKIDFDELVNTSIEQLEGFDGMKHIEITRSIQLDAPFYSDPQRLSIVFNNMISNAVKYQDMNKSKALLDISIHKQNGSLTMNFKDNGCGIAPQYMDGIFDMFTRASERSSGSGLGLYIVRGTVDRLGGTISVSSELGIGTNFEIQLPSKFELN